MDEVYSQRRDVLDLDAPLKDMAECLRLIRSELEALRAEVSEIKDVLGYAPGGLAYQRAKAHFEAHGGGESTPPRK